MEPIEDEIQQSPSPPVNLVIKKPYFLVRLSIVALVYTLQGASLEFLQYSVQTQLVLNGASNSQLAILSTMEYPWCLKFLWAPLQDAFFISKVGRRKTWVLGTLMCLAILWGVLSMKIQDMVDNLEVQYLAVVGIITSIFLTSQDVSMDGLKYKFIPVGYDQEMSKYSWWCSFGYSLGGLVSFTLYLWLSSDDWCEQYIGRSHLLNSRQLVIALCICFLAVTIFVSLMREDKDIMENAQINTNENLLNKDQQTKQPYHQITYESKVDLNTPKLVSKANFTNFQKVIGKLRNLFYNRNIIFLGIFLFFSEVGFTYFDNIGYVEILNRGVSDNIVAFYWLIATICEGITGYIVAYYCAGRQMKIYLASFILRTLNGGFYSLIIYELNNNSLSHNTTVVLFGFQQCFTEIGYAMATVSLISFFLSICDTEVEGSYVAILTSILYSAPIWTATIIYIMSDIIDPGPLIIFSLSWDVLYFGVFFQKVLKLQSLSLDEWKLKGSIIQEKEIEQTKLERKKKSSIDLCLGRPEEHIESQPRSQVILFDANAIQL